MRSPEIPRVQNSTWGQIGLDRYDPFLKKGKLCRRAFLGCFSKAVTKPGQGDGNSQMGLEMASSKENADF